MWGGAEGGPVSVRGAGKQGSLVGETPGEGASLSGSDDTSLGVRGWGVTPGCSRLDRGPGGCGVGSPWRLV